MHSHLPFLLLLCVSLTFFSNRQPTSETAALPVVDGLSSLAGCPRWNRLCCLWPDALDGTASAGGARAVAGCVGCRCLITESDANSKRTVAISSVNSSYKTDQSVDLFNMGDSTATVSGGDNNSSERNAAEEVSRILEQSKELQESAAALISQNSQEEASLRQGALPLDSNIKSLHSFINSSVKKGNFDPKDSEKLVEELSRATYTLSEGDAAAFLPSKSYGRFLRTFLGPINVHATRKDVQLKVKEEYNNFRDRTAYLFLFFPSLLLLLRSWVWNGCFPALPVQLYQAWLLFLYTGLALRENILRVNGSDIRPWWIYHHYCAMLMALISLTWGIERQPDCSQKQKGIQLFLKWAIMQGVAMLLQNRYQRQRLYTRIALGKARRMDVVWGETAGVEGQIWLLYPILFVLQAFEAYVGLLLLKTAVVGVVSEWQVVTCGILLITMAVGNFINTVQTLVSKSRVKVKAKLKKAKSKSDLLQGSSN